MPDNRKKFIEKKEKVYSIILIGFSIIVAINTIRSILKLNNAKNIVYQAEDELRKEQEIKKELEQKLQVVKSLEFIESQIRNELGMVKEGEIMVILPDDDTVRKFAPKIEELKAEKEKSNWEKWIELFWGH